MTSSFKLLCLLFASLLTNEVSSYRHKIQWPSGKNYDAYDPALTSSVKRACYGRNTMVKKLIRRTSKEYSRVMHELGNMAVYVERIKIYRIKNNCLWNKYLGKQRLVKERDGDINERMLFSSHNHPFTVAKAGFDERYLSLTSGPYGAAYVFSNNFLVRKTHQILMLSRVTLGKSKLQTTPEKNAHTPVGFSSVHGPNNEFAIYHGDQAYVEYIITFKFKHRTRPQPQPQPQPAPEPSPAPRPKPPLQLYCMVLPWSIFC